MLNSVNYPDIISLPDPAGFSNFVNLPDLMIPSNPTGLSDSVQDFYPINDSYQIKAFDQ